MPRAEFFARLGLFVARGFFDPALCRAIRGRTRLGSGGPGTIFQEGAEDVLDPSVRSVRCRKASPDIRSRVSARFEEVRPQLAQHFGIALGGFEDVQFLRYETGDFYHTHRDRRPPRSACIQCGDRKVSVVLFLNSTAGRPEPGAYGGGSLTFYGLVQDPRGNRLVLVWTARRGC